MRNETCVIRYFNRPRTPDWWENFDFPDWEVRFDFRGLDSAEKVMRKYVKDSNLTPCGTYIIPFGRVGEPGVSRVVKYIYKVCIEGYFVLYIY